MATKSGNVDHNDYSNERAIKAHDDRGPLTLVIKDDTSDNTRRWSPKRVTKGDVVLEFEAFPRRTTVATPPGPRSDIRQNGPGLVGAGHSFVPKVIGGESGDDSAAPDYNLQVSWDLAGCPESTEAVWTFGKGPHPPERVGAADVLVNSVYAVSPEMSSWTPSRPGKLEYGFYWLTEPPSTVIPNVKRTAESVGNLVEAFAEYFAPRPHDKGNRSTTTSYRIFCRETPRGNGGSAFRDSFILEWDRGMRFESEEQADEDRFYLLAHEAAHNWPQMQPARGQDESGEATWYEEGAAEYFGILLPYELGLVSAQSFTKKMSMSLSAFYTSPAVNLTLNEAAETAWTNSHAQRLPYYIGTLNLFRLDAHIRKISHGRHSLKEPVKDLLDLKRQEKPFGFAEWQEIIERYVGDWSQQEFESMSKGGWVVPPPSTQDLAVFARPGDHLECKYKPERLLEMGYTTETKGGRTVVKSVVSESEAHAAGMRTGDVLTWRAYNTLTALDDPEAKLRLSLERDGKAFDVEFLPRSKTQLVDSWQIVHT